MRFVQPFLELLARNAGADEVEQHKVIVGAARHEVYAAREQSLGQTLGVLDDLFLIGLEFGAERLLERDGFGCDDVHKRTALRAGKDNLVDLFCKVLVVGENETAARSAKSLVGGGGDKVGVRHGTGVQTGGDKTRNVCDVNHKVGAHFVGNFLEPGKVNRPCVGGSARDDEFGSVLESLFADVVEIYPARLGIEPVGHEIEQFAAEVDGGTVGEVSALGEGHTEHGVAGLQNGVIDREIGIGAAVSLNVGEFGAEQFLGTLYCEFLRPVDVLAPAVITLAGITLGVLIGVESARRRHNRGGNDVFAGNQFEIVLLTAQFLDHRIVQFGVYRLYAFEVNHFILL